MSDKHGTIACAFLGWLPLLLLAAGCEAVEEPLSFRAVTFNTGTSEGMGHDEGPDDGYGEEQAVVSDEWYGNGLAWEDVVRDTIAFFSEVEADVVGFQEIFYSGECADIPAEARAGFVCEGWQPGDPTVAQVILGQGWQVACHEGKSDKCLAVRRSFGSFAGCDDDLCLDGLDGGEVEGCGSGSRVGRGVVELAAGGELTLVNVHGSSGLSGEDKACRAEQFALAFEELADGDRNLVLGDFNTDPGRWAGIDESAAYLAAVAEDSPWRFLTDVGDDAEPTYGGLANIDHVLSDSFTGSCAAGVVSEIKYFDHLPQVCEVGE